ncbi:MAG TPA: DNA-processing protein DprA [bacterium]|nr:DNA-processing protein DprA [bacterium]
MNNNDPYLLALNAHPKIGSQTIKKILAVAPDLSKLWNKGEGLIGKRLEPKVVDLVKDVIANFDPESELMKIKSQDLGYLTYFDSGYPVQLKEIYDAPIVLYIRGSIDALGYPSVAIVGSRKCTYYGRRVARQFSKELAGAGLAIVSGLALGVDGEAHIGALEGEGITVGVLGCGIDQIYPSSHTRIASEIIAKGGAVISEFPPGTPAYKQNFPARNRIIAGLSLGTLVVEAAEGSGSLITAICALEYGREIFAIPGNIEQENSRGTNKLIQQGAKLVLSPDEILSELRIRNIKSTKKAKKILPESEEETQILHELSQKPCLVDEIVEKTGYNIIAINSTLTMMEMKGMIENTGGGRYRKIC